MEREVVIRALAKFSAGLAALIIIALLLSFPLKWLWNWLMPEIFNLTRITTIQALGLSLLSSFLFRTSTTTKDN